MPQAKVAKDDDPEATFSGPLSQFDPDSTISSPGGPRRRNPFAPKALPEALQANLAALGGLNQLIAFANPIFSAIPQISAARDHPDPARLKETLQDLVEAFEAGACKAEFPEGIVEGAVFALCCLSDDAATATPWGQDWLGHGLLKEMRDKSDGGEGFFALLAETEKKPEENADLLEFLYICLSLGFQGRYRVPGGGGASSLELDRVRADLHALVTRRRGRPAELSERWRPATVVPTESSRDRAAGFSWRAIAAPAFALLLLFVGYKISQRTGAPPEAPTAEAQSSGAVTQTPGAAAPVARSVKQVLENELAAELKGGAITLAESGGRATISLAAGRQFPSGKIEPSAAVKAIVGRIAAALDRTSGPVIVRSYTDSVPVKPTAFASNVELSEARSKAVAALLSARLADPKRVSSEGAGEAEPIAPNDIEANRARNRRVVILVGPAK